MAVARAILSRLATSERLERTGSDAAAAIQRAQDLAGDGVAASLGLFGELVQDPAEADRVTAGYLFLADQLSDLPEGRRVQFGARGLTPGKASTPRPARRIKCTH